ncbi:MAG: hypothetical protein WCW17_03700 [Patescibacteria group bacterium]
MYNKLNKRPILLFVIVGILLAACLIWIYLSKTNFFQAGTVPEVRYSDKIYNGDFSEALATSETTKLERAARYWNMIGGESQWERLNIEGNIYASCDNSADLTSWMYNDAVIPAGENVIEFDAMAQAVKTGQIYFKLQFNDSTTKILTWEITPDTTDWKHFSKSLTTTSDAKIYVGFLGQNDDRINFDNVSVKNKINDPKYTENLLNNNFSQADARPKWAQDWNMNQMNNAWERWDIEGDIYATCDNPADKIGWMNNNANVTAGENIIKFDAKGEAVSSTGKLYFKFVYADKTAKEVTWDFGNDGDTWKHYEKAIVTPKDSKLYVGFFGAGDDRIYLNNVSVKTVSSSTSETASASTVRYSEKIYNGNFDEAIVTGEGTLRERFARYWNMESSTGWERLNIEGKTYLMADNSADQTAWINNDAAILTGENVISFDAMGDMTKTGKLFMKLQYANDKSDTFSWEIGQDNGIWKNYTKTVTAASEAKLYVGFLGEGDDRIYLDNVSFKTKIAEPVYSEKILNGNFATAGARPSIADKWNMKLASNEWERWNIEGAIYATCDNVADNTNWIFNDGVIPAGENIISFDAMGEVTTAPTGKLYLKLQYADKFGPQTIYNFGNDLGAWKHYELSITTAMDTNLNIGFWGSGDDRIYINNISVKTVSDPSLESAATETTIRNVNTNNANTNSNNTNTNSGSANTNSAQTTTTITSNSNSNSNSAGSTSSIISAEQQIQLAVKASQPAYTPKTTESAVQAKQLAEVAENIVRTSYKITDTDTATQIRAAIKKQVENQDIINKSIDTVNARSKYTKFFIGPDYKNLKIAKTTLEQNSTQISTLKEAVKNTAGDANKYIISSQIIILQDQYLATYQQIRKLDSGFSLMGWIPKKINKY